MAYFGLSSRALLKSVSARSASPLLRYSNPRLLNRAADFGSFRIASSQAAIAASPLSAWQRFATFACPSQLDSVTTHAVRRPGPAVASHLERARRSAARKSSPMPQPTPGVPALGSIETATQRLLNVSITLQSDLAFAFVGDLWQKSMAVARAS